MKKFIGLLSLVTFMLIGCISKTPYQRMGPMGGYSDHRLDANTFLVEFQGNGSTSQITVKTYLLYRCAEVTTEAGYDYFEVVEGDVRSKDKLYTFSTPGNFSSSTTGSATTQGYAVAYGNQATGSAITSDSSSTTGTYIPPETRSDGITKYHGAYRINAFNGQKPVGIPNVYDAHEILKYFGPSIDK